MNTAKYIVIKTDVGFELMFVFNELVTHKRMFEAVQMIREGLEHNWTRPYADAECVGAGFVSPHGLCYGESLSLGIKSRNALDTQLLVTYEQSPSSSRNTGLLLQQLAQFEESARIRKEMMQEMLDEEGENRAVRTFLQLYGCNNSPTVGQMRCHLEASGFDGYWPDWVGERHADEHLTKGGAQLWIRHLLALEKADFDAREQFEQACYAHYLERHAAGKTADSQDGPSTREQLLWRDEKGNYGVLMFNGAWWAYQEALKVKG